jgi:hypothetical protein
MQNLVLKFESDLTNRLLTWGILLPLCGLCDWISKNEFGLSSRIVRVRYAFRRKSAVDPKREALFIRKTFHTIKTPLEVE